jgi:hypothetical protein
LYIIILCCTCKTLLKQHELCLEFLVLVVHGVFVCNLCVAFVDSDGIGNRGAAPRQLSCCQAAAPYASVML